MNSICLFYDLIVMITGLFSSCSHSDVWLIGPSSVTERASDDLNFVSRIFWPFDKVQFVQFCCNLSRTGLRYEIRIIRLIVAASLNFGTREYTTWTVNCYFWRSINSLHLCKEYLTAVIQNNYNCWTFWQMWIALLRWYVGEQIK